MTEEEIDTEALQSLENYLKEERTARIDRRETWTVDFLQDMSTLRSRQSNEETNNVQMEDTEKSIRMTVR